MAPYAFDSENSTKWQAVWTIVFGSAIGAILIVLMVALCGCCDVEKKKKRPSATEVVQENPPEPTPAPPPVISAIELVDQSAEPPPAPAPELELQKSMVETSAYWVEQAQGAPSFAMSSWIKKVEIEPGYNLIQPKKKPDVEQRSKTFKSHQPPTVSKEKPQSATSVPSVPSATSPSKTLKNDKIPSVPKKMPPYTPTPSSVRTTSMRSSFIKSQTRDRSPPRQRIDSPSSKGSLESSRSVQLDKTPIVLGQETPPKPIQQRNQRTASLRHSEAINLDSTTADQLNKSVSVAGDWDFFNQSRSVTMSQMESERLKSTKQRPPTKQKQTTSIRARKPKSPSRSVNRSPPLDDFSSMVME